jgi:hypothetical protein
MHTYISFQKSKHNGHEIGHKQDKNTIKAPQTLYPIILCTLEDLISCIKWVNMYIYIYEANECRLRYKVIITNTNTPPDQTSYSCQDTL